MIGTEEVGNTNDEKWVWRSKSRILYGLRKGVIEIRTRRDRLYEKGKE